MRNLRYSGLLVFALIFAFAMMSPLTASEWNKKTYLTVNESIRVPGAVLQPGEYVMKLMDSDSNRHIVQIFKENESELVTTILAIPNRRLEAEGDTTLKFYEAPAGQPEALRAWFYPGDLFGQEFAYPKEDAMAIARESGRNVPIVEGEEFQGSASPRGQSTEFETASRENQQLDRENPYRSTRESITARNQEIESQESEDRFATNRDQNQQVTRESDFDRERDQQVTNERDFDRQRDRELNNQQAELRQDDRFATRSSQQNDRFANQNQTTQTAQARNNRTSTSQGQFDSTSTLPQTAGWTPLVALIGLVSLTGAFVLRKIMG